MRRVLLICKEDKVFTAKGNVYSTAITPEVGDANALQNTSKNINVVNSSAVEKPPTIDFSHQLCT